jgi:hypothetical protein
VGKPEKKKPLGRSSRRWEDNSKKDLQVVGVMNWIDLAGDGDRWWARFNKVMNFRVL